MWLWHRLAAIAPIQPLAWEPPNLHVLQVWPFKKKRGGVGGVPVVAQCKGIQLVSMRMRV